MRGISGCRPAYRRVASVSYPGVGPEAGIAPVPGLRPGSRGSPRRRHPPCQVTAGSHDLLMRRAGGLAGSRPGPGMFSWARMVAMSSAGTPCRCRWISVGCSIAGPWLWERPGGPRHSRGSGYRAPRTRGRRGPHLPACAAPGTPASAPGPPGTCRCAARLRLAAGRCGTGRGVNAAASQSATSPGAVLSCRRADRRYDVGS